MSNEFNDLVKFEQFAVDTRKSVLWFDEEPVDLPIKAIELLTVLVRRPGEIVSKETLLDEVWKDSFVEENVLSQNIYRLRKQFRELGIEDELIQTIPRRGYRFIGSVAETDLEEISIEHEKVERTYLVSSDNGKAPESIQKLQALPESSAGISKYALAGGLLISTFVLIGAGIWYWNSTDDRAVVPVPGAFKFTRATESGRASEPAISRDNKNIAYVRNEDNQASIVLQNVASKSETVVAGPKPHELRSLNFSANGDYLFYVAIEKDRPDSTVYKIPVLGGTERKILTGVRHFVSLSPSGDRLAFIRYSHEENVFHLVTASTDGTNERVISTRRPPNYYHDWNTYPAWSPDETRMVMPAHTQPNGSKEKPSRSYFIEIDLKTGREKQMKHPDWQTIGNAAWLSDGSGLIVSAQEKIDGFLQLWRVSYPDGKATPITNDTNHYRDFRLSYDSKTIVAAMVASSADLYIVSAADPENVERLTSQSLSNYGRWGLDWSSDGEHLIYVKNKGRNDGNLWKINLNSKKEHQLTFFENASVLKPRSAPDGSIFFASNTKGKWHIWQIRSDGTDLKQVTNGKTGENYPDISSDGAYLFFSTPGRASTELWKMLLPNGEPELIRNAAAGVIAVSPTDPDNIVSIYFDPREKDRQPWKLVLQTQTRPDEKTDLKIDVENHSFAWDIAGTGIFFGQKSMNRNDVWFQPIDGSAARKITDFQDRKVIELSVSPDGNRFAVSREKIEGNVFMITGF